MQGSASTKNVGNTPVSLHISINNSILNTGNFNQTVTSVPHRTRPERLLDSSKTLFSDEHVSDPKSALSHVFMTPKEALEKHSKLLTNYEKGEILDYSHVYFVGNVQAKLSATEMATDSKGYYTVMLSDHIAYRYEILQYIGKGSFGQALRCFDHKEKKVVALKILRSKKKLYHQGMVEAKILRFIRDNDPEGRAHIVKMLDYFLFRKHIMITTELLSINLYTFLEKNEFHGVSLGLIKRFARQMVEALCFLEKYQIIHCDLKPENILLEEANRSAIKLIDFGSSCFSSEKIYTYIQSRFYRAPEIMLGIPYTTGIDMWSTGCILSELFTGYPLFPGKSQLEQMAMIMEVNGVPPMKILGKATRYEVFFKPDGTPIPISDSKGNAMTPGSKSLSALLKSRNEEFVDFVRKCLVWDPEERMTPAEAREHPWLTNNLKTIVLSSHELVSSDKKNTTIDLGRKGDVKSVKMTMNGSFIRRPNPATTRNKQEVKLKDLSKLAQNKMDSTKHPKLIKGNGRRRVRLKASEAHSLKPESKKCLPTLEDGIIQIISPRVCKLPRNIINKLLF